MKELSNIKLPSLDESNKDVIIVRSNFEQIMMNEELVWQSDVEFFPRAEYYEKKVRELEETLDVLFGGVE